MTRCQWLTTNDPYDDDIANDGDDDDQGEHEAPEDLRWAHWFVISEDRS